jgi:hypothetical protein
VFDTAADRAVKR